MKKQKKPVDIVPLQNGNSFMPKLNLFNKKKQFEVMYRVQNDYVNYIEIIRSNKKTNHPDAVPLSFDNHKITLKLSDKELLYMYHSLQWLIAKKKRKKPTS